MRQQADNRRGEFYVLGELLMQQEFNSEDKVLAQIDVARRALAEAKTIQETKKVLDIAVAAEIYAKRRHMGEEAEGYARAIKIEAWDQLGQMLDKTPRARGGRPIETPTNGVGVSESITIDEPSTLSELGLDWKTSSLAQQIANLPTELKDNLKAGKIALDKALKVAKKELKKQANEEARKKVAVIGAQSDVPEIVCGNFLDVMDTLTDNSVDLIFTDPPYDKKSIYLYGELAQRAARVLKPGGSLLAYVGHYALPDVLPLMGEHLRYWWLIALSHQSGNHRRLEGVKVYVHWKPMLWYVKETYFRKRAVADLLETDPPEKVLHDWEQGIIPASYYIDYLTEPGDFVLDPMCGSGTTCIAALKAGRKAMGIEIDPECASIAKVNIHGLW